MGAVAQYEQHMQAGRFMGFSSFPPWGGQHLKREAVGRVPITGLLWQSPKCSKCGTSHEFRYSMAEVYMIATAFLVAGVLIGHFLR